MPGIMAGVTPLTAASNTFVQGAMGSTRAVRERGVEACGLHPLNLP